MPEPREPMRRTRSLAFDPTLDWFQPQRHGRDDRRLGCKRRRAEARNEARTEEPLGSGEEEDRA